ncbi:MAG: hypothetical protein KDH20_06250 [Rhodocyclaceae bacterium]|nr:hypothetical protein [Rhodocyclaceae bacterium]
MVRNTRLSTTRAEIGGLATGVSLGSLPPPKGGPSTETVLKALHERIAALEGQLELLRQVIAVDSGGNLTVAVPGHITLSAGGALHLHGTASAEATAGSQSARLTLGSTGAVELSGNVSCTVSATTIAISSSSYRVDAPLADFSSVLKCATLTATNVVAATYSPGAGNVW